jgi:ribonuclease E
MKMIMPSHAKNVKHYTDPTPLFAKYKVEGYLADMFNPTVQLKSGGYIVIGITEALVAIDVNSGRATKEGSIEETATKTNLEAAEEVARQVRLRDLAGLIVIDFIDMDERRNNLAVEKRLKDKLKTDRARIQVGRISSFGLLEMSRQRLRPGMLEATTQPCKACHGTGLIRSDDSLALSILRQLEEEGPKGRAKEVKVTAPVAVVNYLMNEKREYLAAIELRYGMAIRIEADGAMIAPDYSIERFKTATRRIAAVAPVISMDASLMDDLDEDVVEAEESEDATAEADEAPAVAEPKAETADDDEQPKKKRRRRRGGRGRRKKNGEDQSGDSQDDGDDQSDDEAGDDANGASTETEVPPEVVAETQAVSAEPEAGTEEAPAPKPKRARAPRTRKPKPVVEDAATPETPAVEAEAPVATAEVPAETTGETPVAKASSDVGTEEVASDAPVADTVPEPEPAPEVEQADHTAPEPALEPATAETAPPKPKRRGWWSIG